eukprot:Selendium_serpulae@DN3719_c0_g1_i2.p1
MSPPDQLTRDDNWSVSDSGTVSDVVVRVKDNEMRLHSHILAAGSPVLKTLFETKINKQATREVNIEDCNFETATHLFKFLYTGACSAFLFPECVEVLKVANKYQVELLEKQMATKIERQVTKANCLEVLMLGSALKCAALREASLEIASHVTLAELKAIPQYKALDRDAIKSLYEAVMTVRDGLLEEEGELSGASPR